ncbi:DUF883 family protein [Tepidicella xavieri]|jgi:ElaB/YqjD/DUF883 family membrane-anchored ribosome-binding protein|uniref:ElaB/YqjD/DUF883 family membrane-anchored ribosome-binding protein n=1 Tax=Tepidicella xavieri TaxID=360241 RepID=A0A4R6U6T0_9BURK|nr:YqjD family protein [Tepidicella xavieri]TDQ40583.1 ElaB/YqjD/DUF883 family membrane-anchored ribosome-binding protein [Tepidicella xavieri]
MTQAQQQPPKDKLMADLKVVMADAEELLAATASHTGERITELRERMQENLRNARHKMGDLEDALRVKTREVARATDDYVHEHPWKSIGMAAGLGLIVGLLISRR